MSGTVARELYGESNAGVTLNTYLDFLNLLCYTGISFSSHNIMGSLAIKVLKDHPIWLVHCFPAYIEKNRLNQRALI